MRLEFLQIGRFAVKQDFLQHITEMININLEVGDNYLDLFKKLMYLYPENKEKHEAIKNWIDFNFEHIEDRRDFETVICEEEEQYASFNLTTQ